MTYTFSVHITYIYILFAFVFFYVKCFFVNAYTRFCEGINSNIYHYWLNLSTLFFYISNSRVL